MQAVSQEKYNHLGYLWGPNVDLRSRSWLQFADNTAIISGDNKSAQALLDLNTAWCVFADMKIRIDKCSTFGMRKQSGNYMQFQPMLTIGGEIIPAIENGGSFKYLGKMFDYDMKYIVTKTTLVDCLKNLLKTTSELALNPSKNEDIKPVHSKPIEV